MKFIITEISFKLFTENTGLFNLKHIFPNQIL